jgi:hypothetical protein
MKYIDTEKLKAEIERHIKDVKDARKRLTPDMGFFEAKLSGIYDVMAIIDSLQQEQPEPTCKTCGFYENNCPFIRDTFAPYPNKVCEGYTYSVMKEQEQPEVDLEKEIENFCLEYDARKEVWFDMTPRDQKMLSTPTWSNFAANIARHFYELGKNSK